MDEWEAMRLPTRLFCPNYE